MNFDRIIGSSAADMPNRFQGDTIIVTPNLAAWDFRRPYGKTPVL